MQIDINPFHPDQAAERDFDGFFELTIACIEADNPRAQRPTPEAVVANLRVPMTTAGPSLFWTARHEDRLVGMADVHLPDAENAHLATVRVSVEPRLRCRGIGTELLRAVLGQLGSHGRERMVGQGLTSGGAGELWAAALGFEVVHRYVTQRLDAAEADPDLWQVSVPRGYRTHQWRGAAPDDLVESFVRARAAVHDAPRGDASRQIPDWTVERMRQEEADFRERAFDYFVVAVSWAGGEEVVGFTEMLVHPNEPTLAMQQYTAVMPTHRGHGLGRVLKTEMMRWLLAESKEVTTVTTTTGASNVHMRQVNELLGYSTIREAAVVEGDVRAVTARLTRVDSDQASCVAP